MDTLADVLEDQEAAEFLGEDLLSEVVADKGYHSNAVLADRQALGIRTYISEPGRGRRNWRGKSAERRATYANRRRIRGERGKRLLRRRGEILERGFAHWPRLSLPEMRASTTGC
jgi:transposase